MGYSITSLAVDPLSASAGETPPASFFADLAGSLNFAHCYNTVQPINQGWPDGLTVTASSAQPLLYRVPTLTHQHTKIRFYVTAKFVGTSSAGGDVVIRSLGSNQTATINFATTKQTQHADLTIDPSGAYDDIRIEMTAPAECSVTLYSIDSAYRQVPYGALGQTSQNAGSMPRAKQVSETGASAWIQPLQDEALGANCSLSSFIGHALAETAHALTMRRRSLGCWSGQLGIVAPGNAYLQEDYRTTGMQASSMVRLNGGTLLKGIKYHIYVNALPDAVNDQVLKIRFYYPGEEYDILAVRKEVELTVPADTDGQIDHDWFSTSFTIPEDGRAPSVRNPQSLQPYMAYFLSVPDGMQIRSYTVWGE